MKAETAVERITAAAMELLHVHDAIKHGEGIAAQFPYEHKTNAGAAVKALEEAEHQAMRAARLIGKLIPPAEKP